MIIVARNKIHVQKHKAQIKKKFDMKDLGKVKKILGMEIPRDRGSGRFWLSLKVLERFNMTEVRPVTTPLAGHFKLSSKQYPQSLKDEEMSRVLYASAVGSLIYVMAYSRSDLAYAVSTASQFISNPEKQHWEAVSGCYDICRGLRD